MTVIDKAAARRAVLAALEQGRPGDALVEVSNLVAADPRDALARHYASMALNALNEPAAAEREMRLAVEYDPNEAGHRAGLADLLAAQGRKAEAEAGYRAALSREPRHPAAIALTGLLLAQGRAAEALPFIEPQAARASADAYVLAAAAAALNAVGRKGEAEILYRRALALEPNLALLEHNLAAVLEEMQRYPEAEEAALRAIAKGSATSVGVLGRALQGQDKLAEAEQAFRVAVSQRPGEPGVHRDLAELVWLRTGSREAMTEMLDQIIRAHPTLVALQAERAALLTESGDPQGAYASLKPALDAGVSDRVIQGAAAQAALSSDPVLALAHARKAMAAAPDSPDIAMVLAEILLANGEAAEAEGLVSRFLERAPDDQYLLALRSVTWRVLGDDRYRGLYDYDAMVGAYDIETPEGWPSLEAYLDDLAEAVSRLHQTKAHPIGQSLRGGTQTQRSLTGEEDPAIRAFFQAIQEPIAQHRQKLGQGDDPVRRRNHPGDCALAGAWSVRLAPGGFHANHVHRQGWLSSAFYIRLPKAVDGEGRQGWIKFGQPERPTRPALEPEHFVQPKPGRLVLFPSYMWHGTVPFEGEESRLTIAFDVIPH